MTNFPIQDTVGAWVPHGKFVVEGAPDGALKGLRFGVKDVFDVAGHTTGAGNPQWLATHAAAEQSSPLVDALLAQGAQLMGKLLTDELAYSLNGDNLHYGTPVNTLAPDRVTGGSSSGSAAAVAAKLLDFALGTDTGGSTRVPASYCGLWGLRTTHGALSSLGMVPLHPSYDTPTWLAHSAQTFEAVGRVLLPETPHSLTRVLIPADAWALADAEFQPRLQQVAQALQSVLAQAPETVQIAENGLEAWRRAYVTSGAYEGWQAQGEWITRARPSFSPAIAQRWDAARLTRVEDAQAAAGAAALMRQRVRALLGEHGVMVLPSAAGLAPLRDAQSAQVDDVRMRTMRITSIAGLAGLPQVSMPFFTGPAQGPHLPLGISLVGPAGSDLALIRLARKVAAVCDEAATHTPQR